MLCRSVLSLFLALPVMAAALVQMEAGLSTFSAPSWTREDNFDREGREHEIKAVFCIKRSQEQRQALERMLLDVSTPTSPAYGKHLTKTDMQKQFAMPNEPAEIVTNYLKSQGITNFRVSPLKDLIFVKMSVDEAETVLNTKFGAFHHERIPEARVLRITQPYYLPAEVADVVSLVDDILRFPKLRESRLHNSPVKADGNYAAVEGDDAFSSCGDRCMEATTPSVLQERYGYPTLTSAAKGNSMAVVEFQFEYFDEVRKISLISNFLRYICRMKAIFANMPCWND